MGFMDSICNDEDYNLAQEAEEGLYTWALSPFLPIFADIDPSPSKSSPFTLRDYLFPQVYRYVLFVTDERLEPRLNYTVPDQLRPQGLNLGDFALHPNWSIVRPEHPTPRHRFQRTLLQKPSKRPCCQYHLFPQAN